MNINEFVESGMFIQTLDLLEGIPKENIQKFREWMKTNGIVFEKSDKTKKLPDGLTEDKIIIGQCFCNAQKVILCDNTFRYFEGIAYGKKFHGSIYHGFNIQDEIVSDYTLIFHEANFLEETRDGEFVYFGIQIPEDFIKENSPCSPTSKTTNAPLLYKYYLHNVSEAK